MKHPNSPRYERWLNEAASTFKDPERAKRALSCFIEELRREEDEPESAPLDPVYEQEYLAQFEKQYGS